MKRISTPMDAVVTVLALGVTLSLAELSYRFFERPILRAGHRVGYVTKPE